MRPRTDTQTDTQTRVTTIILRRLRLTQNAINPIQLECGTMPNVMAVLPNMGGALCSTPQSLADAHYQSAVQ